MEYFSANTSEKKRICQGERTDSHSVRKQPITACEYEHERQPLATRPSHPSYSARNADSTRNRNRCSEPTSMMSHSKVMLPTGLESLRDSKQPITTGEFEMKILNSHFSSQPNDNF